MNNLWTDCTRGVVVDFFDELGELFELDRYDDPFWFVRKEEIDDLMIKHFKCLVYKNVQPKPWTGENMDKAEWECCILVEEK